MGQQQLLLLVLSTVIVGLATVAGIQAFQQNQTQSNADALVSQSMRYASDLQAKFLEPKQFGGYGKNWSNATNLTDVGATSSPFTGANGKYALKTSVPSWCSGSGQVAVVAGGDNDGDGTYGGGNDNSICIAIDGPNTDDITTTIKGPEDSQSISW